MFYGWLGGKIFYSLLLTLNFVILFKYGDCEERIDQPGFLAEDQLLPTRVSSLNHSLFIYSLIFIFLGCLSFSWHSLSSSIYLLHCKHFFKVWGLDCYRLLSFSSSLNIVMAPYLNYKWDFQSCSSSFKFTNLCFHFYVIIIFEVTSQYQLTSDMWEEKIVSWYATHHGMSRYINIHLWESI